MSAGGGGSGRLDLDELTPVEEALDLVLATAAVQPVETVALSSAPGRILGEDVGSDVDVPPFDRCAMDGYAFRAADVADAPTSLKLIGTLFAGQVFDGEVGPGQAVKVMTGAPLPPGADAVQMIERTRVEGERVVVYEAVEPRRHVAPQAEDLRVGDVALRAGCLIGPAEIALLATIGCAEVPVRARPFASVLSTGDELVEVGEKPGPGQIRNSNGPMLAVLARCLGCDPVQLLPVAADTRAGLEAAAGRGLESDILLVSGGVSKGERDLVGDVLQGLGVEPLLHGINLQPGKPLWFGRASTGCLVFGLPGNPVSSLTTGRIFAGAAIRKMRGFTDVRPRYRSARLTEPFSRNARRPGWLSARVESRGSGLACTPIRSSGSADLTAAGRANATWVAPQDRPTFAAGDEVDVVLHEDWLER